MTTPAELARRYAPDCPSCGGRGKKFRDQPCRACAGTGKAHLERFEKAIRDSLLEQANTCLDRFHPVRRALDGAERGMKSAIKALKP